jgi:hypothetical protein
MSNSRDEDRIERASIQNVRHCFPSFSQKGDKPVEKIQKNACWLFRVMILHSVDKM